MTCRLLNPLRRLPLAMITVLLVTVSALAAPPLGGGSLPLADVMERVKRYPNLVQQIRLELVRGGLKRDAVACVGRRFGNEWTRLGGERTIPYSCPIGRRTLFIEGTRIYIDASGKRIEPTAPRIEERAVRVLETRLTWSWRDK